MTMSGNSVTTPRSPVQELHNENRPVKTRASKACTCCRARKIKCSVVVTGIPCTKCVTYQTRCVVSSRKRRRFCADYLLPDHSPDSSTGTGEDVNDQERKSAIDAFLASAPTSLDFRLGDQVQPIDASLDTTLTSLHFNLEDHAPASDCITENLVSVEGRRQPTSSISQSSTSSMSSPLEASSALISTPLGIWAGVQLPNYIRALPLGFDPDDIEFLNKKGALTLPKDELRDQLLRSYVQHVHPFLPLIDIEDFLAPIEEESGSSQISLMLFHAVMFAAAAYIDFSLLQAEGHESRKSARKFLFQKAKLLYDFGYESDGTSLVQALLLMSYWYERPTDQKDAWHWVGAGLSYANAIGLHRNPIGHASDVKGQRLRKRLWWSCFIRDRLIALSSRKPLRIRADDFDVPMLVLDDFDVQSLSPKLLRLLGDCAAAKNVATKTTLARLCIEKAKLCICIGHVLTLQYSLSAPNSGSTLETSMMLSPNGPSSAAKLSKVMECDQELSSWYDNLPPDCCFHPSRLNNQRIDAHTDNELVVHCTTLGMIYSTTMSALHRPQILPEPPSQLTAKSLQELSRLRVKNAATQVTEVAQVLQDHNLTRFLPPIGVTVLIPAVLVHLLDVKSDDRDVREISLKRFHQCMQILHRLQETYAAADSAMSFLQAVANVTIPHEPERGHEQEVAARIAQCDAPMLRPNKKPIQPGLKVTPNLGAEDRASNPVSTQFDDERDAAIVETAAVPWRIPSGGEDMGEMGGDFNALADLNTWSDLFMADDGLRLQLDVNWAVDFSADVT